jgi:hypothetical protein
VGTSDGADNLDKKFGKIVKQRVPHIIAQLNDIHINS